MSISIERLEELTGEKVRKDSKDTWQSPSVSFDLPITTTTSPGTSHMDRVFEEHLVSGYSLGRAFSEFDEWAGRNAGRRQHYLLDDPNLAREFLREGGLWRD